MIKLQLLKNALDFIDSAVEHLASNPSPRDLEYAIINLAMGI